MVTTLTMTGLMFQMKEVLGIEPVDVKETVIEMAYSLIEGGFIKKTKKYKGPGGIEVHASLVFMS